MKIKYTAFFILLLFLACKNEKEEKESINDTTPKVTQTTSQPEEQEIKPNDINENLEEEVETENQHLIEKKDLSELAYLIEFIPKDYKVLDFEYGDLNKDELVNDVILIAHNPKLEKLDEADRPLYILTRTSDGKLKNRGRNDKVTLCSKCGGVFGDPYQGITIKNGYFSIEHYGGSSWRWTQIITFKFNPEKNNWFLHKKGGEDYHTSDPNKSKETVKTTKDFGIIPFDDYK